MNESKWCDQEIGWPLGRGVPVMSLRFDAAPYGFFGRHQADPVPIDATAEDIARRMTLDRIADRPELALKYAASLVFAMNESGSYAQTNAIWRRLSVLSSLHADLCLRLLDADKCNSQVYDAYVYGTYPKQFFPRVIIEFVNHQPGAEQIRTEIDRYIAHLDEPDFAKQQQKLSFWEERDARQKDWP